MMTSEYTKDFPILDAATERKYIIKAQNGDKQAFDYLVISNQGLVVSIAKRYQGRGIELEDLIQIGNMGLMHSIQKYDTALDYKLSTYATWWIRQYITRNIQIYSRTIRTPCHLYQKNFTLMMNIKKLERDLGYTPTEKEILENLNITQKKYDNYKTEILETISLNNITTDNGQEVIDIIADSNSIDPTQSLYLNEIAEVVKKILNDKEWVVFYKRVGLYTPAMTYIEIGVDLGVSKQYVQQVWKGIQVKLRRHAKIKMLKVS
jgi:RNA polymerase primary sigma factor